MFEIVKPLSRKQRDISLDGGENYAKPKSKRHGKKGVPEKQRRRKEKLGPVESLRTDPIFAVVLAR